MKFFAIIAVIVLAFFASENVHASRGAESIYLGGSLFRSATNFKSGTADSNFGGWGGAGVFGLDFTGGSMGFFLEGEVGRADYLNTFQSATYMEKATNTFMAAKTGLTFGSFGIGGGAQQNNIDIDNVATVGSSGRNSYKGLSYMGFARLSFDGSKAYQTILEVKYGFGQISGLDLTETQFSLRFIFSPF